MERRGARRMASVLDIELTHDDQYVGRFQTRDISRSGAFVEVGDDGPVVGDFVIITFNDSRKRRHCLHGVVVRRTDTGIGVAYSAPDRDCSPDRIQRSPRADA